MLFDALLPFFKILFYRWCFGCFPSQEEDDWRGIFFHLRSTSAFIEDSQIWKRLFIQNLEKTLYRHHLAKHKKWNNALWLFFWPSWTPLRDHGDLDSTISRTSAGKLHLIPNSQWLWGAGKLQRGELSCRKHSKHEFQGILINKFRDFFPALAVTEEAHPNITIILPRKMCPSP